MLSGGRAIPVLPLHIACHARSLSLRRSFVNLSPSSFTASTGPQVLHAHRMLPYPSHQLYALIADVDSYAQFLPYCKASRVTRRTETPDANGRKWPTHAELTAGWGGFEETYTSRLFCIPSTVVEAIGGDARSEIPETVLQRHGLRDSGPMEGAQSSGPFKNLVTRWTVAPADEANNKGRHQYDWSTVDLTIKFEFSNSFYGAISSAVSHKVAPVMVDAFTERARKVLREHRRAHTN